MTLGGGREMESGIDASRRGPMPASHFQTDTVLPRGRLRERARVHARVPVRRVPVCPPVFPRAGACEILPRRARGDAFTCRR